MRPPVAATSSALRSTIWSTPSPSIVGLGLAWGIAIAVVATLQLAFALGLNARYDRLAILVFLLGPLYPVAFWLFSAAAALRAQIVALVKGPQASGVVWDIRRLPRPSGD